MNALNRHAFPPVLSIGLCGLVLLLWACAPVAPATRVAPAGLNGAVIEPPASVPPVRFARTDGATFTPDDTRGRISLFFFGYTNCPDVCPLTLSEFEQIRAGLGSDAANVDLYFVTLDPQRDTLERMQTYVRNFPGVVGLVGSDEALTAAQSAFNVVFQRRDLGDGNYALDHTAATYLVNPSNQIQLAYPYGTTAQDIVSDLRTLVRQAG